MLADSGTTIVKFFLSIDKDEQRKRFQARYDDPTKRWKFSMGDLAERKRWDDYQRAFDDALTKTSTDAAPWYVIPADRKWFRNLAVSSILADTIADLKPAYPPVASDVPAGPRHRVAAGRYFLPNSVPKIAADEVLARPRASRPCRRSGWRYRSSSAGRAAAVAAAFASARA